MAPDGDRVRSWDGHGAARRCASGHDPEQVCAFTRVNSGVNHLGSLLLRGCCSQRIVTILSYPPVPWTVQAVGLVHDRRTERLDVSLWVGRWSVSLIGPRADEATEENSGDGIGRR